MPRSFGLGLRNADSPPWRPTSRRRQRSTLADLAAVEEDGRTHFDPHASRRNAYRRSPRTSLRPHVDPSKPSEGRPPPPLAVTSVAVDQGEPAARSLEADRVGTQDVDELLGGGLRHL